MRSGEADAERYWDARARQNPLFFVDTNVDRERPDAEAFWRHGEDVVDRMTRLAGVELAPDDVVLDIGCGVGRLTRALAARVARVHGLDVSGEMLRRAAVLNEHLDNVEWVHGDGYGLAAVAESSVTGCFSHVVFQHIPDPAVTLAYVRDMGRVLRPGGWALFQVSTDPAVHRDRRSARARLAARLRGGAEDDRAWRGSAVRIGALRAAATAGGLEIEAVFGVGTQYTTVHARRPLAGVAAAPPPGGPVH